MAIHRYRLVGALVAAALALSVATACGSSEEDPGTSTGAAVDTSAAPQQVTWESYRGVAVPVSAVDGPTSVSAKIPFGYSRTPQGVVMAAIQGQSRLALAPDETWAQTAQLLTVPGRGRDAYAVARVMTSITTEADPAQTAQFAGFRIEDYSPDEAVVWLATRMPDAALSASPTSLLWQNGDWKITLPDPQPETSEAAPTDPVPLTSLDGYTAFSYAD
ncbi:hypothetical protein ABZU78_25645 [Rhodococcus erythropolis]|uniref:hypothetical protein n=1 Tax=Rhodococcus erythropolis TaxID=1833 RepID=UPI0033B3F5CD